MYYINIVVLKLLMLHVKFQDHLTFGYEDDFNGALIWASRPPVSYDLDRFYELSFTIVMKVPSE